MTNPRSATLGPPSLQLDIHKVRLYSFQMLKPKPTSPFDALNASQRRAATHGTAVKDKGVASGPMLILAGAGTGKTSTLAHRAAHLVLNGVDPARVLMLTFTLRAAQEVIHRTQSIVAQVMADRGKMGDRSVQSRLLWSGTYHSVGNRVLRLFANQLGLDPSFTVLSRTDAAEFMGVIHHELGFSGKEKRFPRKETCLWIYSYRVNTRLSLKETLADLLPQAGELESDLTRLYREYVARKQKYNVLDIDDLLLYWHVMMQTPALAQSLSNNFDHVLVDEYQETTILQSEIIHALKPDGQGLTVAGDDAQAIYSLRARTEKNTLEFANRYTPKAETVVLAQNYRSTQQLLDCANALVSDGARQYRKTLLGMRQSNQRPLYVTLDDEADQVEYIVGKIMVSREIGGSLKRHAILFRSARHSDALELELTRRNIPFVKYGGSNFLDADHIKDVLSILRWVDNPRNSVAGFRVLKLVPDFDPASAKAALKHFEAQGFSFKSLAAFDAHRSAPREWKNFSALLEKLADPGTPWPGQVGLVRHWYKPHLERLYDAAIRRASELEQLEQLSVQYPGRERFLTEITVDPPTLTSEKSRDASNDEEYVILSTIHAAKGQEWDIVYLLNVAEGIFPLENSAGKPEVIEEERHLLYVAMTRARNELHLCAPLKFVATKRTKSGDAGVLGGKSRFMTDKFLDCCERSTFHSIRGVDKLRAGEAATVDVASKLKEMW
jgi:DNA helicase II / ATP-dependent DNA helicase PcrA